MNSLTFSIKLTTFTRIMNKKELKYNYDQLEMAWKDGLSTGLYIPNSNTFEEFFAKNLVEEEPKPISETRRRLLSSFKVSKKDNSISIPNRTILTSEELEEIKSMGLYVQFIGF